MLALISVMTLNCRIHSCNDDDDDDDDILLDLANTQFVSFFQGPTNGL